MGFDKPYLNTSNPYKKEGTEINITKTIYYGEVISIDDPTDGGRIKVKIPDLDNKIADVNDIPWAYPFIPKFFHSYPQVGEYVRILIENIKYPQRSRYWTGSVISQPQKIGFDSKFTALSTTNMGHLSPEKAPSSYPDAEGVFPTKTDIAIVGKVNTDIILKINEVHLRAGKHENDNILKLNTKNPAQLSLIYEKNDETNQYDSSSILMSDKIAIISHSGKPKFKSAKLTQEDRKYIFENGHPMVRGDVLVEIIKIFRNALINHIHGYSNLPADKTSIIKDLENLNLEAILQKNIIIN